jgi:riboflavin-specific deaminase-like protein
MNNVKMGAGGIRFEKQRLQRGLARHNTRIIVSGTGSINPDASIFRHRFSPIVILTTERVPAARRRVLSGLADELFIGGERQIDFVAAFRHLRSRWNIRRLLCEGGAELNDALWRARLVDELHLTICPKIFGGRTAPTIVDGLGFLSLPSAALLHRQKMTRVGRELFLVYRSASREPLNR